MAWYDVVCGKEVDETASETSGLVIKRNRTKFLFCSAECKERFSQDPSRYIYPFKSAHRHGRTTRTARTDSKTRLSVPTEVSFLGEPHRKLQQKQPLP
jgi:YHS domain-containing protein